MEVLFKRFLKNHLKYRVLAKERPGFEAIINIFKSESPARTKLKRQFRSKTKTNVQKSTIDV